MFGERLVDEYLDPIRPFRDAWPALLQLINEIDGRTLSAGGGDGGSPSDLDDFDDRICAALDHIPVYSHLPGMAWNGLECPWNGREWPGMPLECPWNGLECPWMGWNGPGMPLEWPWNAPGMPLECPGMPLECPWNALECPWNGLECP